MNKSLYLNNQKINISHIIYTILLYFNERGEGALGPTPASLGFKVLCFVWTLIIQHAV